MTYLTHLQKAAQEPSASGAGYLPLTEQLTALTAHMPPLLLHRPWSINELLPLLKGRYRKRPAARSVAQALVELGWTRHRNWTNEGRNQRYWFPPMDDDS